MTCAGPSRAAVTATARNAAREDDVPFSPLVDPRWLSAQGGLERSNAELQQAREKLGELEGRLAAAQAVSTELGEDALKQAKDAFAAADVNSSNDLDREEVEKVLLSMGISSASELAEIFLSSDRMDFDGFCIMIAPETARKCREALGVAPKAPSGWIASSSGRT